MRRKLDNHALTQTGFWDSLSAGDRATLLDWAYVQDLAKRHILFHEGMGNGAAWNNDESLILTWGGELFNGTAIVWDVASGERRHTLPHERSVKGAAWNGDESLILTWSGDLGVSNGKAVVWDAASGERRHTLAHEGGINGAAWKGDESLSLVCV